MARGLLMGVVMLTKALRCSSEARQRAARSAAARERAFTLIELMTIVVIVGVLATVATYGVRKYVLSAKKAEAVSMLTQIRAAEEAYRDETFNYLGGGTSFAWHPTATPGTFKSSWDPMSATTMGAVFSTLGVRPDGPVMYAYSVVAGNADSSLPDIPTSKRFDFPEPTGPFYIAMAMGDLNGDGRFTYALSHSDTSEVYVEDSF